MPLARSTFTAIGGVALVCAIGVGGYVGGWWIREDSVNRQARINQDSYSRQNALVEQVLDDIAEAQGPAIPNPQRLALIDQVCDSASKLTGSIELPRSAQTFIAQECPA